jgi:hypothetical protein
MTYRGHIKNGVAVLDDSASLPEGTPVRIEVDQADSDFSQSRTVEQMAEEQGVRPTNSPEDLAIDWPEEDSIDHLLSLVREVRR